MTSNDLKCNECIYNENCPAGWSRNNAACLTIRKPNESAILYNIIDNILSGKKLDEEMKSQLDWDYMAHNDIRE